jgi:hypothetical protein
MIYTHAIAALVAAVIAAFGAWQVQDWRYGAKEAQRLELEREVRRGNAKTADKASEAHEQTKAEAKTEFQTIYQEVERVVEKPVYRNVCFDDDGLRLVARALGDRPTSRQSSPALPGTDKPE